MAGSFSRRQPQKKAYPLLPSQDHYLKSYKSLAVLCDSQRLTFPGFFLCFADVNHQEPLRISRLRPAGCAGKHLKTLTSPCMSAFDALSAVIGTAGLIFSPGTGMPQPMNSDTTCTRAFTRYFGNFHRSPGFCLKLPGHLGEPGQMDKSAWRRCPQSRG